MEGDNIIGMFDVTGGGAISLEPGGQFELSGAPLETVHQTAAELIAHLAQVREVAEPLGIGFLGLGMTPNWTRADMPMMPKGRYKIMTDYMPKVGTLGLDMMYRTCTVQANLDFSSEADMVKKLRVSLALQPVGDRAVRQFAVHRRQAERLPVDALAKSGATPTISAPACCPSRSRTAWASSAMSITRSTCRCISSSAATDTSTCRASRSAISSPASWPICRASAPTHVGLGQSLSTIFPEVRLKRYLEMRGADGGPWRRLPSLPAFWVGLLYDDDALDAAWDLVKDWTAEERQKLRDDVPQARLQGADPRPHVLDLGEGMSCGCARGLERRKRLDRNGRDETRYLRPLEEIVARGITPAEELLEKFHGSGTARSSRSTTSMRIDLAHHCEEAKRRRTRCALLGSGAARMTPRCSRVTPRLRASDRLSSDEMMCSASASASAELLVRIAHQPDAAGRQFGETIRRRRARACRAADPDSGKHRHRKARQHRGGDRAGVRARIEHAIGPADASSVSIAMRRHAQVGRPSASGSVLPDASNAGSRSPTAAARGGMFPTRACLRNW